jgi:ferredoxin
MKRILLVGTGPSGFAVLNSLDGLDDVWVMDGQTDFHNSKISTRSHLALKQKFGSDHTYTDSEMIGIKVDDSYKLPISYSRGGFGEIWGTGFTPYNISKLFPKADSNLDASITQSMKELLSIIPFSHVPGELDQRFGKVDLWSNSKHFGHLDSRPRFDHFLKTRASSHKDGLLFGHPNLLLDSTKCTNCGLCLTGCPYGALFDPGEQINKMFLLQKLNNTKSIKGFLQRLEPAENKVKVFYSSNGEECSEWFDEVILSTGPLSTALILMNSGLLPDEFDIPDSQVFYGAFLSKRRFRAKNEFKEVAQMVCYPEIGLDHDFQISFYTPTELSRVRISQSIFPTFLRNLRIPKVLSERIIPAIGFLPEEVSGKIHIEKSGNKFKISRQKNPEAKLVARNSLKKVSFAVRRMGLVNFPFGTRVPAPGAGFHIGASLPLGGDFLDMYGYLLSTKSIRILDASILPKIPAGAHTFLTMALIRALIKKTL